MTILLMLELITWKNGVMDLRPKKAEPLITSFEFLFLFFRIRIFRTVLPSTCHDVSTNFKFSEKCNFLCREKRIIYLKISPII